MDEYYSFVTTIMAKISHYTFVEITLNFIKYTAASLVAIQLISKYLKARGAGDVFVPKDIIRPLVLVCILVSYNYFMDGAEKVMSAGDAYIQENITSGGDFKAALRQTKSQYTDSVQDEYDDLKLNADQYPDDYTASGISQIVQFLKHPGSILIKVFGWIGDFFGTFIYLSALLIRAFMLFVLKLLGPIAVVLSIYDKWHNAMYNWLRYYSVYFLWLFPIYAANTFMDVVTNECYMGFTIGKMGITTMVALIGIIVKFVIMKGSLNILTKLFANAQGE